MVKLGGCVITFTLCDQFGLSVGSMDELSPAVQGVPMYSPKSHLMLALWFKQQPLRPSVLEKCCHPMFPC